MIVFNGWKLQNICRDFSRERRGRKKKKGDKWAELNLRMGFESFCCVWEVQWLWKEQG